MFSSGKNDGFKCLIYMHRYNEDTLARINSQYFLHETARVNAEIKDIKILLEKADEKNKIRLERQLKELYAKQKEMIEYGQVLDHMANKYINLDLDDGVKTNYEKFQGIEIVSDSGARVKKDLLVPIR
jgi:type II restriction/modification system DNA methylase subunit YeeA